MVGVFMNMNINIYYMYYDLLNVYGDRGNILILKNVLNQCGINCDIKYITINDYFDYKNCDILFMGGGQDYEQITVGEDIIKNKLSSMEKYIEDGGAGLYICGSYQLLGKKYVAADGRKINGAGILDIYTEKGDKRYIGDIVIQSEFFNSKLVGFENHSGRTYINNYSPLGKVIYGNGNNGNDGSEGLIYKNTICTYLHGCCLSKNPEITGFLISSAVLKKYNVQFDVSIEAPLLMKAKNYIIDRYSKQSIESK